MKKQEKCSKLTTETFTVGALSVELSQIAHREFGFDRLIWNIKKGETKKIREIKAENRFPERTFQIFA